MPNVRELYKAKRLPEVVWLHVGPNGYPEGVYGHGVTFQAVTRRHLGQVTHNTGYAPFFLSPWTVETDEHRFVILKLMWNGRSFGIAEIYGPGWIFKRTSYQPVNWTMGLYCRYDHPRDGSVHRFYPWRELRSLEQHQ